MVLNAEGAIKAVETSKLPDGKILYKNYILQDGKMSEVYSVTDFSDKIDVVADLSFNVYHSAMAKAWKVSLKDVREI